MTSRKHDKVEILVVGSGVAGSTFAAELALAGREVLVLEAGPPRETQQMISSEIWSRRLKWGGPPMVSEGDMVGGLYFGSGWGTGGAGAHWYGHWFRLHEQDFKVRSLYGKGLDWPIEYKDLSPYYDRAQRYFGVSGDRAKDPWSPPGEPYPMPALAMLEQSQAIQKGFEARGLRLAPSALAINSEEYQGRSACLYDGWCDAGCPIGALANPLVLQWPRARKAGARLRNHAYVARVTTDRTGKRATGVEYFDEEGKLNKQPADVVIVAAHTISNCRLLLTSANGSHPAGLANASGLLGKHIMSHAGMTIYGIFNEATNAHLGVTGGNGTCQDNYDRKDLGNGIFGSRTWLAGQSVKPNGLLGVAMARPELYGAKLEAFLQKASKHFGNMTVMCEETSVPANRIEMDSLQKDAFGLPLAKIINHLPEENVKRLGLAKQEGLDIFNAANTSEVWTSRKAPMHIMGGTVMGKDASDSVTNAYGQTHQIDNLFVAGASLFPTCGAVNPTGTLAALVLRTADFIKENFSSLKS